MTTLVDDRPASRPEPAPRFPAVEEVGRGLCASIPGQGYGYLSVVLDAGGVTEGHQPWGVAALAASLFGKGSASRTALQTALAAESLGASLYASSTGDGLVVGAAAPVGVLRQVGELVAEALWSAAPSVEELETARSAQVAGLASRETSAAALANDAFKRALYPDGHRFSVPGEGTTASVEQIDAAVVQDFVARRWQPARARPTLAGDLAGLDVAAVLETLVPGLEAPVQWDAYSGPLREGARRVLVVDRPGSVQSYLLCGHVTAPVKPDFDVPDSFVAAALGGLFDSRLNTELRERRGVTYGVGCGFNRGRWSGELSIGTQVRTDATVDSLVEVVRALELMQAEGPTAEELEKVRIGRVGSARTALRGSGAVSGAMGAWVLHDRDVDSEQRKLELMRALTLDDVRAAAHESLRPQHLLSVVVGDAASFLPALQDAGLGPVEVAAQGGTES